MSSGNILVVDDNAINRTLLCEILRRAGYEPRPADGGPEALAMMAAEAPELVLLDIQMPGMSGYDVCLRIKADPRLRTIPVVFISALDDVAEKVKGFQVGGADYVTKPFEVAEVLARAGNQLSIFRLQKQLNQRNAELLRRNEQLMIAQQKTERVFLALSEVLAGTVLDDTYRLDAKIGEGGFGAVFRAVHLRLQRPVAVKVLRPDEGSPGELARFRTEGIAACRIAHPNAIEVLDFGVSSGGIAYLVMELLSGRALSELLREEPLPSVGRCAEIVVPICEALVAAHAAGILHRDIKPHNIFLHQVAGREVVKVLDFGIAKLMDRTPDMDPDGATKHGSLVGTPEYMAPERLLGQPYDERSDIYSVGVLLYFMLSAAMPFRHASPPGMMDMVKSHLTETVYPLADAASPNIPAPVTAMVMKSIHRDPAQRPTLEQIAATLRSASA